MILTLFYGIQEVKFQQPKVDYSLFTHVCEDYITVMLLYVNDMVISGDNEIAINDLKKFLNSYFHINDLKMLKYFLNIKVTRSKT